ncbi:hypothetical protein JXR01_00490 [Candidatus Kaiserbacteria bacterium]|nr:MAG: hypothetical protein JXR01_00490 [Candidatus Kaiserbacteria bacterium]
MSTTRKFQVEPGPHYTGHYLVVHFVSSRPSGLSPRLGHEVWVIDMGEEVKDTFIGADASGPIPTTKLEDVVSLFEEKKGSKVTKIGTEFPPNNSDDAIPSHMYNEKNVFSRM